VAEPKKRSPKERGLVAEIRTLRERLKEKDAIIQQQNLAADGGRDYLEQQRRDLSDALQENERLKETLRSQGRFVQLHAKIAECAKNEVEGLVAVAALRTARWRAEKELQELQDESRARKHVNPGTTGRVYYGTPNKGRADSAEG
jgi:hypothetical protein